MAGRMPVDNTSKVSITVRGSVCVTVPNCPPPRASRLVLPLPHPSSRFPILLCEDVQDLPGTVRAVGELEMEWEKPYTNDPFWIRGGGTTPPDRWLATDSPPRGQCLGFALPGLPSCHSKARPSDTLAALGLLESHLSIYYHCLYIQWRDPCTVLYLSLNKVVRVPTFSSPFDFYQEHSP
jgi:hypothetical protein